MKKILIAGNWKMNPESEQKALAILKPVLAHLSSKKLKNCEVAVFPPSLYIKTLSALSKNKIAVGGQDAHFEKTGPFTGETSAFMLKGAGAKYCILGHSSRRAMGETNAEVSLKINACIKAGLIPIICIGEKHRDHSSSYLDVIKKDLSECMEGVSKASAHKCIFTYEPVWAISGKDSVREAHPSEFLEASIFMRKILSDKFDAKTAHGARILYGGSVGPDDAYAFAVEGKADGFLIGKNSLDPKKFIKIIDNIEKIK